MLLSSTRRESCQSAPHPGRSVASWTSPAAHSGQQFPHLDDVGVLEAWNAFVLADNTCIFFVAAVAVAPAPVFAVPDALLISSAVHVVQPDPPCQTQPGGEGTLGTGQVPTEHGQGSQSSQQEL